MVLNSVIDELNIYFHRGYVILKKLLQKFETLIDIALLVYARIVLGVLIAIEFSSGFVTNDAKILINPESYFFYLIT